MALKTLRVLLKVISGLFFLDGIYLIVTGQKFLGIVAIIVAFLFFPSSGAGKQGAKSSDYKDNGISYEREYSSEGHYSDGDRGSDKDIEDS
ncbi:hypothetical protein BIV60_04630 [Bacillus sp. MUM 116]|uniref:hypothetical protein n=1 Tax=Bacillus sp. MUM 116 TaxID=1678002 RepID=UPI0008F5F13E|nr:hypothetical protein [Bacillus sp. MUM 116]OIK16306.1 hypothetical protein BIV60_04630 [Bacillus sp. MUM 116]